MKQAQAWLSPERFDYARLDESLAVVRLLGLLDAHTPAPRDPAWFVGACASDWSCAWSCAAPLASCWWLSLEEFEYRPLDAGSVGMRLRARLMPDSSAPTKPMLHVLRRGVETRHRALSSAIEERSESGLLWVVRFGVPLQAIEAQRVLFTLSTAGRQPVSLPGPDLGAGRVPSVVDLGRKRFGVARARRHLVAVGASVAVATASGAAANVAAADTAPTTTTATTTTAAPTPSATPATPTTTTTAASAPSANPATPTTTTTTATTATTTTTATPTPPPPAKPAAPAAKPTSSQTPTHPRPVKSPPHATKPERHPSTRTRAHAPSHHNPTRSIGTGIKITRHKDPAACEHIRVTPKQKTDLNKRDAAKWADKTPNCQPVNTAPKKKHHKHHAAAHVRHASGGAGLTAPQALTPRIAKPRVNPGAAPARTPPPQTIWTAGFTLDPFTAAQLQQFSTVAANLDQPPSFLIPIYKAAGRRYHIPWQILAAINAIETNYGQDLAVSPKGAIGWMQFMPGTWLEYGMAADGRQRPNPYDPRDAIFSAARYLAANGAPLHIRQALYAYNHALWYVDAVLWRAQLIADRALGKGASERGYALPLDARYMRQLGRTDDGVDIEDAPDGAAVYSITPGIVTAVASDPTGFGPNYPVILVTDGPLAGQYIYYGHVAASLVHIGQHVIVGQPIAVVGHTGDAASLGHGHIEIGFSDGSGDPLNHHGENPSTPSGAAMRRVLIALCTAFRVDTKDWRTS